MTTSGRWQARRWFRDHEIDIHLVAGRRVPSIKMRNLMIREGELERVPVGSFGHCRFVLTEQGRALLDSKGKRKRKVISVSEQLQEAIT